MEGYANQDREIFSRSIKAGKRWYFIDVKSTKTDDYYVVITESKKHIESDGRFTYTKHRIFLYKEDFEAFKESLDEVMDFVLKERPDTLGQNPNLETEHIKPPTSEKAPIVEKKDNFNADFSFDDL